MRVRVLQNDTHGCNYLPGFAATTERVLAESLESTSLDLLLAAGFRHFGRFVFRPACVACSRCIPLRIRLAEYSPSRSERRILTRNADLRVETHRAKPSVEAYNLYLDHKTRFAQIPKLSKSESDPETATESDESYESYAMSFYDTYEARLEMSVYLGQALVSRIHLDLTSTSSSAIYCYYDDSKARRSLGTFSILRAIEYAKRAGCRYFYLGYYVRDNHSMSYKIRFYPSEILSRGVWINAIGPGGEGRDAPQFDSANEAWSVRTQSR